MNKWVLLGILFALAIPINVCAWFAIEYLNFGEKIKEGYLFIMANLGTAVLTSLFVGGFL